MAKEGALKEDWWTSSGAPSPLKRQPISDAVAKRGLRATVHPFTHFVQTLLTSEHLQVKSWFGGQRDNNTHKVRNPLLVLPLGGK